MTRRRDPFGTALAHLTGQVQAGAFGFGQPIVIAEEAAALRLSTTPVREALAWLCGYGLVERSPMGGYLTLRLDAGMVRSRLGLRLQCLKLGRDMGSGGAPPSDAAPLDLERWMTWSVRATGDPALVEAFVRVSRQLAQLAEAERDVFADIEDEAGRLVSLFEACSPDLQRQLEIYHRRRMEAAPLLVLAAEAARERRLDGAT